MTEAAFAHGPCCHIVAPNVRVSATTWRSCETSFSAFLAEVSRALHTYTVYKENLPLLIDDVTAFDFVMQMAHQSFEEECVRKSTISQMVEKEKMVDNQWYERRDKTLRYEKTHEANFHKELAAVFKKYRIVFPVAAQAIDGQVINISPTLALLVTSLIQGLNTVYQSPAHLIQTMVPNKFSTCLFNFFIFAKDQSN